MNAKDTVVSGISGLLEQVKKKQSSSENAEETSRLAKISDSLSQLLIEFDETDPAIANLREAKSLARKSGLGREFHDIERDVKQLIEADTRRLFPKDLIPSRREISFFLLAWICLGCVPLTLVLLGYVLPSIPAEVAATAGTIGDSFGMANAFFSGLALLFVAATMYLQRKELMLQRNELRLTRDEMRRSSNSQDAQAKRLESAAKISAFSQIYDHYRTFGDRQDMSEVRKAIASGKKSWTIKHIHLQVETDDRFIHHRNAELAATSRSFYRSIAHTNFSHIDNMSDVKKIAVPLLVRIAKTTAELMGEERIGGDLRELLYSLYLALWRFDNNFPQGEELTTTVATPKQLTEDQKHWLSNIDEGLKQIREKAAVANHSS